VRFYSKADSGLLDRVCAPMDYGPGGEVQDGLNRTGFGTTQQHRHSHLGPPAQQIVDLQVLGEVFDRQNSASGLRPGPFLGLGFAVLIR